MERLTVLYDARCKLCSQVRAWLEHQPCYVQLEFVAAGSGEALQRFPQVDHSLTLAEMTVVDDAGGVYYGAKGWVMCLWALKSYRGWALRLSTPELMPLAQRLVNWVSANRFVFGGGPALPPELEGLSVCVDCKRPE